MPGEVHLSGKGPGACPQFSLHRGAHMEENYIQMLHITKRFPGIIANDDVTLNIRKGEVYALLGENGAGKSTLMSVLFGMYQPDAGEIRIGGKKVSFSSSDDAAAAGIGMVHQHFKLVDNYTVAENIILGVEPMKKVFGLFPCVDMKRADAEVAGISKEYGLEVNPTDMVGDLAVSVRQRVEILKMLYRKADILIFDEPTAVLTPKEIEFLLEIIGNLRKSGKTIILITHKIEEIQKIADRCAILRRGKLVGVYDVKTTSLQKLANLMVGRELSLSVEKKPARMGKEILKIENLTVRNADHFEVVKNVSLTVHEGEIFSIAGVAGNGQVDLADAVAGMQEASGGKIILDGTDITNMDPRARSEAGLSYIPEDRQGMGLFLDFSLSQNLGLRNYYKRPYSSGGIFNFAEMDKYSDQLIEKYDIRSGQGSRTTVRSMSGGNQQKAIVGREIEQHRKLIIFVQPTRGLDLGAIENIHRQIIEERDRGAAILLVSLELDEIMQLSDTIGVIYNGSLLKTAPASDMDYQEVGRYMMGVKDDE